MKRILHHLFVPSANNNFRARLLHHDILTFYLIFALLFVFSLKGLSGFDNVLGFATDISVSKLYELTNKERRVNHLADLSLSAKLSEAAREKAKDMFAKNYWAHYAPGGKTPWNFMLSSGYRYEYAGENLAKNFLFSKNVVDAWMKSETHKENILRSEYSEVGYAIVNGVLNGEQTTLVVQMFGRPLKDTTTGVENNSAQARPQVDLAGVQAEKTRIITPAVPFSFYWFFVVFLSLALILDFYFALRLNIIRFHGRNIPHIIFIIFISIGFLFFLTRGAIL